MPFTIPKLWITFENGTCLWITHELSQNCPQVYPQAPIVHFLGTQNNLKQSQSQHFTLAKQEFFL